MTHQMQVPWHQAHTQRMLECSSTISTTNKNRLPPNGAVVLPAFYPLFFFLFEVMDSTRPAMHKHLSSSPGTPGSTKPKWQWKAQPLFLSSKPALTGTRVQRQWQRVAPPAAGLNSRSHGASCPGKAPGNSHPLLTGSLCNWTWDWNCSISHSHGEQQHCKLMLAAQQELHPGCATACVVLHLLWFLLPNTQVLTTTNHTF